MKKLIDLVQEQHKLENQLYKFYEQKKRQWDLLGYDLQIIPNCNYLPRLDPIKRTEKQQINLRIEQCVCRYLSQYGYEKRFKNNLNICVYIENFIEALKQNGIDITFTRRPQIINIFQCGTTIYNITDVDKCIQKLKDYGMCDEVSIYQFMAKYDENKVLQIYVRMWAKSDYPQLTNMLNRQIDEYEKSFHVNRAEVHQTYKKFIDLLKHNNIEVQFKETTKNFKYEGCVPVDIADSPYITTMREMNHTIEYLLSENVYKVQINRVHLRRCQFADEKCRPSGRWGDACQIRFFRYRKLNPNKDISQKYLDDIATITHTQSKYKTSKEWYNDMKIAMDLISNKLKDKFWDIKVGDEVQIDIFNTKWVLKVCDVAKGYWFTVVYGEKRILFSIKDGKYIQSYNTTLQKDQQFTKWVQNWKVLRIINRKPNSANWVKMSKDCSDFIQQIAKQKNMTVQQVVSKFLGTETEVMKIEV